jgi:hypothetical protein
LIFKGPDCDTGQYLVVEKVMESLAVSKQITQKFDLERFNLKRLNNVEAWNNIS